MGRDRHPRTIQLYNQSTNFNIVYVKNPWTLCFTSIVVNRMFKKRLFQLVTETHGRYPDVGVAGNTIWIFQHAEGGGQWWIVPLRTAQVVGLLPAAWSLTIWLLSRRTTQSMFGININRAEWPPPPAPQLAGHGWSHTPHQPTFTAQPREVREQPAAELQQHLGLLSVRPRWRLAH